MTDGNDAIIIFFKEYTGSKKIMIELVGSCEKVHAKYGIIYRLLDGHFGEGKRVGTM